MDAGIRSNMDRPGTGTKGIEIHQHRHPLGHAIEDACDNEAAVAEPDEHQAG
jgi:hypothetical protein